MSNLTMVDDDTGNCYAACLSTITGIPFDALSIPPDEWDKHTDSERYNRVTAILLEHGWWRCRLWKHAPIGLAIASGPSPRGDFDHSVVVLDGNFYHDPHPSRAFLETVNGYEIFVPLVNPLRNEL